MLSRRSGRDDSSGVALGQKRPDVFGVIAAISQQLSKRPSVLDQGASYGVVGVPTLSSTTRSVTTIVLQTMDLGHPIAFEAAFVLEEGPL